MIKVNNSIKPVHFTKRKEVLLNIGGNYFVSFGSKVRKCILIEIIEEFGNQQILINLNTTSKLTMEYGNNTRQVYRDEIGLTKEEAIINQVTF